MQDFTRLPDVTSSRNNVVCDQLQVCYQFTIDKRTYKVLNIGTSTFRLVLAPIDIAWRTSQTVLWDDTTPYFIVGVAIEFLEDSDYVIYPNS